MGKPGSPWGGAHSQQAHPGGSSRSSRVPAAPAAPSAAVRRGQDRALEASDGKAAPCPEHGGHGHPIGCQPRGAAQGSMCAHLLWTQPTPSCARTCKLTHTCSHAHVCTRTPVHAHAHCVLVRMRAHAHLCTHVLTCTHTQTVYGHTYMHLYTHTSLSCTLLHTIPHTCLPRQSHMHTHTFTAWTLISHTHPHPHTHIQTPAVAPGPTPPCQAQAQPTHCETNTGAQGPLGIRPHRAPPGKSCGKEQREPPGTAAAPQDTHAATT